MGQTIELLENALRAWEDINLIDEVHIRNGIQCGTRKPQDVVGPIRHWRELRNHLLMIKGDDFDISRFCFPGGKPRGIFASTEEEHQGYETLPLQLASWMLSSRRVFHVSDELAQRFLNADYSNYKWSDLLWPFDAFAVSTEQAVTVNDDKQSKFQCLLVSSVFGVSSAFPFASQTGFECRVFITEQNGIVSPTEILSEAERNRFEIELKQKRWGKLSKRILRWFENIHAMGAGNFRTPPGVAEMPYGGEKEEPIGDELPAKILAGLCLYLEALPAGMVENYPWHQSVQIKSRREIRKIITDGEQVCRVNDFHIISPDTMTLFPETLRTGPAYSVTPHWRRAHYRRKKGQGHNPNAPRDVYVGPAKIHEDQLPKGAVVGGAVSNVK